MNQKKENELNLALMLPEAERVKTSDLNTGFDTGSNEWELIVRYSGNIRNAADKLSAEVKELLGGYALIKVGENRIDELAALPEVIFIEKPKKLITSLDYSVAAACIPPVWDSPYNLSGEGVVVAVIDSGIDYAHPDFCNDDGTTRLVSIYDETTGTEYTGEQINAALKESNSVVRQNMIPIRDISGHGTHVTGIAAGNGRASQGRYRGVAYKASIISVCLGEDAFFNTARLMEGVDYAVRKAQSLKKPVALNISIGNNYGAHDGYSLLENYLNTVSAIWQNVIVAGSGNEAAKGIHVHGRLSRQPENTEMVIGENETSLDIQLWKQYADSFLVYIYAPDGTRFGPFNENTVTKYIYRDTMIYVYYGEPKPYSSAQEIFIQMIPTDININAGIWYFRLVPEKITDGEYDFWLPAGSYINRSTGFTVNDPDTTLTIPSTALNVITVGAYDAARNAYADFSGRGYTRRILTVKPDIVAPGVGIMSAAVGGGYTSKTGTSMAAPFVTGSAALMMEWGIIRGNDAFLYGEKVKSYLIKGAAKIPGEEVPSRRTGWGRLCLRDSFPTQ